MSANTKIEWADHTFNPWIGCTKVSPGCDNCYAKADFDDRRHRAVWGPGQPRSRTQTWGDPVKWNKQAFFECPECGKRGTARDMGDEPKECKHLNAKPARARVFCASLADVFDNEVDPQWRADLFELIEDTPNLDWLLLTKRIGNVQCMLTSTLLRMRDMESIRGQQWPWPNVWIGATIVNQEEADRDIPKLLAVPAAKRFLSMEPLLGPVELGLQCENWSDDIAMDPETGARECCKECDYTGIGNDIDWVIVGGESGPGARPMHPDWARSLRDQCQAAGVPFLFKQWGEWQEVDGDYQLAPEDADAEGFNSRSDCVITPAGNVYAHPDDLPDDTPARWMERVGKKAAGRLLDGREWNGVPA